MTKCIIGQGHYDKHRGHSKATDYKHRFHKGIGHSSHRMVKLYTLHGQHFALKIALKNKFASLDETK